MRPVLLAILDGFAIREEIHGNAIAQANTPNFNKYWEEYPHTLLEASGNDVGLPEGQMGNSEVGHLNIGAGRIVYQELTRIAKSIQEGYFFENKVLKKAISYAKEQGTRLHFCGLFSDGGVHSHIDHLFALIELCEQEQVNEVCLHLFLDGRDVNPRSAHQYICKLQEKLEAASCGVIATIQGRFFSMDRDRRWDRTEKAFRAMVYGEGKKEKDVLQAIEASYKEGVSDEFVEPIVMIDDEGVPIGTIQDKDAIIHFNFRPDRAIQLSLALTQGSFKEFDRGISCPVNLYFVSFTHYHDDVKGRIAFCSHNLKKTLGEVLSEKGCTQLRIAETEKYPHVTYFMNGGRESPFEGEERILINSPKVSTYDLKPEMSAYEVTDTFIKEIEKEKYDVIILNFANPDMVGHSGKLAPTIRAVEVVDACLGKVIEKVHQYGGCSLITADHGNADRVLDEKDNPVTSHTTYPVPCIVTKLGINLKKEGILADIAPTILALMGIQKPKEMTGESLIQKELEKE